MSVDMLSHQITRETYATEGFVLGPRLLPNNLLKRTNAAIDEVIAGKYETGIEPLDWWWEPDDDPEKKLRKIDQPHLANRTIHEAICYPQIAQWAAGVTKARQLQVFAVQLLHKPGGGDPLGTIGWHHDFRYWGPWFQPGLEAYTVWLAISDVYENSGPMCYVRGSHLWKLADGGDFEGTSGEEDYHKARMPQDAQWDEVPAVMPAGACSLHHQLTLHGSRANTSSMTRRSLAVHLCTESGIPNPDRKSEYDYVGKLEHPWECPIVYQVE